jgi:2-keto-3-deoxy-6-phosphogluconate aldolase
MKMTWKPWPKRESLSSGYAACRSVLGVSAVVAAKALTNGYKAVKVFSARSAAGASSALAAKFNGAAILVTAGAAIISLSVASIYRPAGGILWGLFLILAAIDMRR